MSRKGGLCTEFLRVMIAIVNDRIMTLWYLLCHETWVSLSKLTLLDLSWRNSHIFLIASGAYQQRLGASNCGCTQSSENNLNFIS